MKNNAQYLVDSITRAADVLVVLSEGLSRLTDISEKLNISFATLHRILKTLEAVGLVTQDKTSRRYYPGSLIYKLASSSQRAHQKLVMLSIEQMHYLWDISKETISLDIQVGIQRVHLQEIPSIHDLKVTEEGKLQNPISAGAQDKVLLAQFKPIELRSILKNLNILKLTQNTVTDRKRLLGQIKKVKKQGYAISYGERMLGAIGISVPVSNYFYPVALSILGPEQRLKSEVNSLLIELKKSAANISGSIKGNV